MAQLRKVIPATGKSDPICPNTIFLQRNKPTTFGRFVSPDVNVRLLSKATPLMISRKHATVANTDGTWTITDHQSLNGVFVNGQRIKANEPYSLQYGDKVAFGCPVGSGVPEFEYIFDTASNPGPSKRTLVESSEQRGENKKRKISFAPSENRCSETNYEKKIKSAEDRIKSLQEQLKQKERLHADALLRMEEKDKDYRQQLLEHQCSLEREKKSAEDDLKCLLAQCLQEKESLLKEEFEEQICILKSERQRIEQNLVEKFDQKLSEKEEKYQEELMEHKRMLDIALHEKEEQQRKHLSASEQEKAMLEKLKQTEENEKKLEETLEKLREDVREKEAELQNQKIETIRVEENAKKQVIETIEDEFTCIICQEIYVHPVTLACAHSFCEHCLRSWVKKRKNCPVCRRKIKMKAVRSLVMNNAIERFVETVSSDAKEKRDALIKEREEMAAARTASEEDWIFAEDEDSDSSGNDREPTRDQDVLITFDSQRLHHRQFQHVPQPTAGPSVLNVGHLTAVRNPFFVSSPVRFVTRETSVSNLNSLPSHRVSHTSSSHGFHHRGSHSSSDSSGSSHAHRRSHHRSSDRSSSRPRHVPVVCFNCGDTGHMSRNCPRR